MKDYEKLLSIAKTKLTKALIHLEYSWKKIQRLPKDINQLSEEQLEIWESFSARFSRLVELFLNRYLRTYILLQDPGFEGSLRDRLHKAEKYDLVSDANHWLALRELRNVTAHDYSDEDIENHFQRLINETPFLLKNIKSVLENNKD